MPPRKFENEADALKYFEEQVPVDSEEQNKNTIPEQLKEKLFDVPENLGPGQHEFEGKHGYKLSFRLVKCTSGDRCWLDLEGYGDSLQGDWNPLYAITDLIIETPNFTFRTKYSENEEYSNANIYWLPNLKNIDSELSGNAVNIGRRIVYLLDQGGSLSRPIDLLGFFHEIGHIETNSSLPPSSTHIMGLPASVTAESTAYGLQREEYANKWILENATKLFEDLQITPELIEQYCQKIQPNSYHKLVRRLVSEVLADSPDLAQEEKGKNA